MTTDQLLRSSWSWSPWVIAVGVATLIFYGYQDRRHFSSRSVWLVSGLVLFVVTLCSPIDTLANGYLFSAHMLQHLLLLLIVPLLILLGWPPSEVPGIFQHGLGKGMNGTFRHPVIPWLLGIGGMWLWHAPTLCNAAVSNIWVHRLQYASLLGMGFAFWWPIVGPWTRQRLPPLAGILYLFTACLGCTILGIIITFSPVEVCSIYLHPADRLGVMPLLQDQWELTPAKDQQLGGLLMWVPACLVYFFSILGLLARWYREPANENLVSAGATSDNLLEKPHGF